MTLYVLKHKGYKTYPINLRLLIQYPYKDRIQFNSVIAFFTLKDAKKAIKELNKEIKYKVEMEIVKFTDEK